MPKFAYEYRKKLEIFKFLKNLSIKMNIIFCNFICFQR